MLDAQYSEVAHAVLGAARRAFATRVIAAIRERRAPAGLHAGRGAGVRLRQRPAARHRVSDEAFAALQKRFGLRGLVDLTATHRLLRDDRLRA